MTVNPSQCKLVCGLAAIPAMISVNMLPTPLQKRILGKANLTTLYYEQFFITKQCKLKTYK